MLHPSFCSLFLRSFRSRGNFCHTSEGREKKIMTDIRSVGTDNIMECSTLELKVVSCSDLNAFSLFNKLSVYSVVSIINGQLKKKEQRQNCLQRQKTQIDREGGRNPEWNHVMKFDIKSFVEDCSHLFLGFDLYSEGVIYGNRSIGNVRVPLKDLIDEFNGAVRIVRYQVRTSHGKPNGVLSFCYKLKGTTITNGEMPSPEVHSSPEIHFSEEKVHYPCVEVDDLSSSSICYPSIDHVGSPLPGFYSPPPKYEYQATEGYNTTLPPLSPPQVSSLMVASGSYYHPYPSQYVQSPWPWHHLQSTGYGYAYDSYGHPSAGQLGTTDVETCRFDKSRTRMFVDCRR